MKSFTRTSSLFATAVALLLATNAPVLVTSRLQHSRNARGRRSTASTTSSNPYKVSFDATTQSSFNACPNGAVVATVANKSNNKVVTNKKVTLVLTAPATSTTPATTVLKQSTKTNSSGQAVLNFQLTSVQMQSFSGRKLKCVINMDTPNGSVQQVSCPSTIQLCTVPNCADTVGQVICQGDIPYADMCAAVNAGQYIDKCVTEDEFNNPPCQSVTGYVLCNTNEYYATYCDAVSFGYNMATCQKVPDAQVPPEAKTGEVMCIDTVVYANMWAAIQNNENESDCSPTGN